MLVPSALALTGFVVLLGLGTWQIERKAWKEALIARLQERVSAQPQPLPAPEQWPQLKPENSEFRRVKAALEFLDRPHAYLFASGSALRPDIKSPGYFVFAPARLQSGAIVVVDVGHVGPDRRYPWTGGKAEIVGYLRWPEAPSWFVADHDASGSVWFVRDHRSMAKLKGWGDEVAPFYIDQESPVPPGGLPKPGPLAVQLRNDHLQYALTWYGLAVVLAVIFAIWAAKRRREGPGAGRFEA
jgi:surfeit locus 1 family protein